MAYHLSLASITALILCFFVTLSPAHAEWFSDEQAIMGTTARVELWHDDAKKARVSIDAAMAQLRRIDALMSPLKPASELFKINKTAATKPVRVGHEIFDLIAHSIDYSALSEGGFDISYATIGRFYDYRQGLRPTDQQIAAALPLIGYQKLVLDRVNTTIAFAKPGMAIDLGGIAKGYAVDCAIAALIKQGISRAIVTAGGDTRIIGDRVGRPWMLGIRDPRNKEKMLAVLPLADKAISTSGDYERYFERDGVRYHHILNPKTGRAVTGTRSVTIIGPDATTTDALSTSVFVLGPKKGMTLIESLPGIEAVIIDAQGKMFYSSTLENLNAPQ